MKKNLLLTAAAVCASLSLTAQLNEDFEGVTTPGLPTGWTQVSSATDGGFLTGDAPTLSSQYFPIAPNSPVIAVTNDDECDCDKSDERLISPAFNLAAVADVYFLKFDYAFYPNAGTAEVQVSTDGGANWTTVKSLGGSGTSANFIEWATDSAYIDGYNGSSNIMVAFYYDDGGIWDYGLGVDNISTVSSPATTDLSALSFTRMYDFYGQNDGAVSVTAKFQNLGTNPVTSFDYNYTVDGNTQTETVNLGSPLNYLEETTITLHGTTWTPSAPGTFPMDVFCSNVNGAGADDDASNDTYSTSIEIATLSSSRVGLLESFSSHTCGPCATTNGNIMNPIMTTINENETGSSYAFAKYQQDYPAPGTDPSMNAETRGRHDYYNVSGIPTQHFNGGDNPDWNWNTTSLTWGDVQANVLAQWDWEAAKPARVTLSSTTTKTNYDLDITVNVDALTDLSNAVLHIVIANVTYSETAGNNGEDTFHHIVRKMAPGLNGTTLGNMAAGANTVENQSYTYSVATTPTQGSYDFWNDDIEVIAWVQNNTTKEVYNAAISTITDYTSVTENTGFNKFKMYPNPTNDNVNIVFDAINADFGSIEIMNTLGQVVYTKDLGNVGGLQNFNLNVSEFENGLYMVKVKVGENIITKTLSIQK